MPRSSAPSVRRRSLGPVADLESCLPVEWWRTLFNATYIRTDGDVVENAANTTADIDLLLAATGLGPDARILDLCCGQGRHVLELARRGFARVAGLDQSAYLVRLARRRARTAGLPVSFRHGDARGLRPGPDPLDAVVILGNSFGYFERQADDLGVLASVFASLAPGGIVAMDISDGDWIRDNFAPRSWEWIDRHHFVCRERTLSADGTRLVCREVVTHTRRGVLVDQFYAERLYSREQLHALLRAAGFAEVRDHGTVLSDSDRNQDLGMMAHRVFVTARRPAATIAAVPSAAPVAAFPFPEVTVLLGDPRLADEVKRDGAFQPEDHLAVRRLKEALAEIRGCSFRFLDRHDTLLDDLRRRPPGFVLNLCDEGLGNDPRRELHVPALLESLGIPCSGSGPAALAACFDKELVTAAAARLGIPVPEEIRVEPDSRGPVRPATFPVLVKPATGDGGVGIGPASVARNPAELRSALALLRADFPDRALLVQEFLSGPEYTVGVLGNPGHDAGILPVAEVDYSQLDRTLPPLLGFDAKFVLDSPYWTDIRQVEAKLAPERRRLVHDHALRLFARFDCRDLARIDFRTAADGTVKLLEINPNPSWRWDDCLATMAGFAGWSYAEFLRRFLAAAQLRAVRGTKVRPAVAEPGPARRAELRSELRAV